MAFDNLLSELWVSEKEPFFNLAVLSNSTTDTLFDFGLLRNTILNSLKFSF